MRDERGQALGGTVWLLNRERGREEGEGEIEREHHLV